MYFFEFIEKLEAAPLYVQIFDSLIENVWDISIITVDILRQFSI